MNWKNLNNKNQQMGIIFVFLINEILQKGISDLYLIFHKSLFFNKGTTFIFPNNSKNNQIFQYNTNSFEYPYFHAIIPKLWLE